MAEKVEDKAQKEESVLDKAYHFLDSFHNVEPERAPSKIGCSLTLLMMPVILVYIIIWVIQHEMKPPVESLVIDWSIIKGPFPMKVKCVEASCWMWLSGCSGSSSDQCIALADGEERELEMCYSSGAREGLHMWWAPSVGALEPGVRIFSQALLAPTNQTVEPGRSSMTYVKTEDLTKEDGDYQRLRREWFVMYQSDQPLQPLHTGCQGSYPVGAQLAQVVMRPEFYDKQLEKQNLWVSVIGEAGGAFGLAQTVFFGLYLVCWYLEHGKQRWEEAHTHAAAPPAEVLKPEPKEQPMKSMLQPDQKDAISMDMMHANL
mmetsp:Transcript_4824/g.11293  ORF Transcript_4824/g.11293 Transcript_4824/m.11293 type:complete len:317 (-) Transcript_4824:88-1038(-)